MVVVGNGPGRRTLIGSEGEWFGVLSARDDDLERAGFGIGWSSSYTTTTSVLPAL